MDASSIFLETERCNSPAPRTSSLRTFLSACVQDAQSATAPGNEEEAVRALLVSHWPVESNAATLLTTGMFDALKADPDISRSEALRRSMMKLAANDNKPHYAHPAFWAPFVVVGEGRR